MPEKELVLELLMEGGKAAIYHAPIDGGGWQFFVESGGIDLDENDDEIWRYGQTGFFGTLNDALHSIFSDGAWVLFAQSNIHPEMGNEIWALAQRTAEQLPEERRASWEHKKRIWRKRCRVE